MKSCLGHHCAGRSGRSPSGERGLKLVIEPQGFRGSGSLPIRGAWIEMSSTTVNVSGNTTSLPIRGAWIEITTCVTASTLLSSLPIRGAWIEIDWEGQSGGDPLSLPIRGAWIEILRRRQWIPPFVSRSPSGERGLKCENPDFGRADGESLPIRGAWIEIGSIAGSAWPAAKSLPIRGAWIEIKPPKKRRSKSWVAPHPGSVD